MRMPEMDGSQFRLCANAEGVLMGQPVVHFEVIEAIRKSSSAAMATSSAGRPPGRVLV